MLQAPSSFPMEAPKAHEKLESPLSDELQVQIIQAIGDVIVGLHSIRASNAAGIGKCVMSDDHLKKRMIQEIKKRIFVGRAVTEKDYEVIARNGSYQDTT